MWINEEVVFNKHVGRNAVPDQDILDVKLNKGRNSLLLKLENNFGGYAFYARFIDLNGQLRYYL